MISNPKQGKEEILCSNFPQYPCFYNRITYFFFDENKGDTPDAFSI